MGSPCNTSKLLARSDKIQQYRLATAVQSTCNVQNGQCNRAQRREAQGLSFVACTKNATYKKSKPVAAQRLEVLSAR